MKTKTKFGLYQDLEGSQSSCGHFTEIETPKRNQQQAHDCIAGVEPRPTARVWCSHHQQSLRGEGWVVQRKWLEGRTETRFEFMCSGGFRTFPPRLHPVPQYLPFHVPYNSFGLLWAYSCRTEQVAKPVSLLQLREWVLQWRIVSFMLSPTFYATL